MLKSAKRSFDSIDGNHTTPISCSLYRIQSLDSSSPNKRLKTRASPPPSPATLAARVEASPFQPLPPTDVFTPVASMRPTTKPITGEPLYAESMVRAMIEKAVAEREAQIRAEYDYILQERLQEQYRVFSKFHEDYISRQLKDSDFSYMS